MIACYRLLLIACLSAAWCSAAGAHGIFKKEMEKKYANIRVMCFACHVKGKPKSARSEFGELFFKEFKGHDFTKNWDDLKEDEDGREKYEKEKMAPAFAKAWKRIKERKNDDGLKYFELVTQAKLDGIKAKKRSKKSGPPSG